MNRHLDLVIGALIAIMFATMLLVVFPYGQLAHIKPPKGLKPYTEAQLRGREVYIMITFCLVIMAFLKGIFEKQTQQVATVPRLKTVVM